MESMDVTGTNLKRAFDQMQRAAGDTLTKEDYGFGVAIAFLTTVSVLAGEAKKEDMALNTAQVDVVDEYCLEASSRSRFAWIGATIPN